MCAQDKKMIQNCSKHIRSVSFTVSDLEQCVSSILWFFS